MLFLLFLPQSNNLTDANSQDDQPSLYLGGAERIVAFPPPPPFVLWRGLNSRRGRGQTDRRRRAMLISSCLLSAVRPSVRGPLPSVFCFFIFPSFAHISSFFLSRGTFCFSSFVFPLSLFLSALHSSFPQIYITSAELGAMTSFSCLFYQIARVEVNHKYDVGFEIIFCSVTYLVTSCGMDRQSGLNKS